LALVSTVVVLGLIGCSKPGPAETAGKKMDQMSESASAAVAGTVNKADDMASKGSETTGQKVDDAEKTVKDRY
jgi:hyperosmotically inducible protein